MKTFLLKLLFDALKSIDLDVYREEAGFLVIEILLFNKTLLKKRIKI